MVIIAHQELASNLESIPPIPDKASVPAGAPYIYAAASLGGKSPLSITCTRGQHQRPRLWLAKTTDARTTKIGRDPRYGAATLRKLTQGNRLKQLGLRVKKNPAYQQQPAAPQLLTNATPDLFDIPIIVSKSHI